jgi:hypothetical protein
MLAEKCDDSREQCVHCALFYSTYSYCRRVSYISPQSLYLTLSPRIRSSRVPKGSLCLRQRSLLLIRRTSSWITFGRCAVDDTPHHMSFRTSLLSGDRLLALDRGIRVCDDTLLDVWIQVINSVGGPAMEFLGTLEMKRLCEFTLASCESGSEVRSVVG